MKVAYATGSRADYGIVRRYLELLNSKLDLSVLVTGSHLDDKYGRTVEMIKSDHFNIAFQAPININNSTSSGVIHSMSIALDSFGLYFQDNKYDLLIILGDRYEMMSVAIAAAMQRIPILHIHGGEATYANYDEFIRHSITKMSTFHFASTDIYRKRIIQLGEDPARVFDMGALGAENCQIINESLVDNRIRILPCKKYYVVVFHPETLTNVLLVDQVKEVLKAIDNFIDKDFVFIGTNADTGSDVIRNTWLEYVQNHSNTHYFENLNNDSYLYLVKNSLALIGNSSSGIIEAPSLGVCTVNVGHRQDGRVRSNSVYDVPCQAQRIINAINEIKNFDESEIINPYFKPNTARNYFDKTLELLESLNQLDIKSFYDVPIYTGE